MKVLITCPPMLEILDDYREYFESKGVELVTPDVTQALSEDELLELVPGVDGWIIGDDAATAAVFAAGKAGSLKAAVKWGAGTDNIDLDAAKECGISVSNTPGMFDAEVADLAMLYIAALARETLKIDREVRAGRWPKPCGISLAGKYAAVVGYGHIGQQVVNRLLAAQMKPIVYDPYHKETVSIPARQAVWPQELEKADFIVLTCALTPETRHLLNNDLLGKVKRGVRIVNVARGGLIDEAALIDALADGHVHSAALDVFEVEPLPLDSPLHQYPQCIFGSHNASNTVEAVRRASGRAIEILSYAMGIT